MDTSKPFVSIQVPSNRPEQILRFLDHLQDTANDMQAFEVIVNLDEDDTIMTPLLTSEQSKRPFSLKYIKTFSGGFYNSWKPINDMLPHTHSNAYFLIFLSDEFLFATKGWDDIVKSYIGYYPDNIFRLRCSQFRYHNYSDVWECGFAPDSIAFTTRKWVDLNQDWAPCFSSDAFQQCVAFYLFSDDPFMKEQVNRDIPVAQLNFKGEGTSIGLEGEKARERIAGGITAWFILMSHKMQVEAKRRAMLLKAHIIAAKNPHYAAAEVKHKKRVHIIDTRTEKVVESYSYRLSRIKIGLRNLYRRLFYLYYTGGGSTVAKGTLHNKLRYNFTYYLSRRHKYFYKLHDWCNHYESSIKGKICNLLPWCEKS